MSGASVVGIVLTTLIRITIIHLRVFPARSLGVGGARYFFLAAQGQEEGAIADGAGAGRTI
jgi:hypothetical protein